MGSVSVADGYAPTTSSGARKRDAGVGSGGKAPDGVFSLNVPFAKGTIAVQVRVTGDAISPAHLARVRKYLELAESEWDSEPEYPMKSTWDRLRVVALP